MTTKPKILAFAGSLRKDSYNKKVVKIAMLGAQEFGSEVTYIDLKDFPLPIYDGDLEQAEGLPENAKKLKQLFMEHPGLLISSPEYNGSISGALKNVIDWVSRPLPGERNLACFEGKVAGLLSASPGAFGGLGGLVTVRSILSNIGVIVIPNEEAVTKAMDAFKDDGTMKDPAVETSVKKIGRIVADISAKLHSRIQVSV